MDASKKLEIYQFNWNYHDLNELSVFSCHCVISEDTGRDEIDYGAILYHLDKAAECCQLNAINALAAILLKFPSDFISNEIPENRIQKFLNGKIVMGEKNSKIEPRRSESLLKKNLALERNWS